MTACATETATGTGTGTGAVPRAGFTIAADGSYAACLARTPDGGDGWYPERWTLGGPEPYTVPLPGNQPEEECSEVLPLPDGRVLIRRRVADRHDFALLYPAGPGTGELPLGSVPGDPDGSGTEVRLLPPSASGLAFALAYDAATTRTSVWLVHDGRDGPPRRLAEIHGRCGGGAWLDRAGGVLALDRETDGTVKTVAVDLRGGGAVSPLLQITDDSNDRLLLAEPDSGLLIVRSDATGEDRIGWGVLGSRQPMRFAECLRVPDAVLTPFAAQPGQVLMPESCAVALRADGPHGTSLAVWRPGERRATWLAGPEGWLAGTGMWTPQGALRLPYACVHCPCGIVDYDAPAPFPPPLAVVPEGALEPAPEESRSSPVLPLQKAPLAAGS
ncbi:hypothetical protein [Streptomyces sp. MI02-7b]|uniref:hypothetical protein n=1 Tax=Streptomyces sp. MI02-7b TaxID=462941 RepID=UPI0029B69869|nr:hypothetical protein [Streptomyces sp. MI02-7b]MDX3075591.1 hypothetical protein [Streptomyces sp. MI02-7b]